MSYTPSGAYEPSFWSIGSHDLKYTERVGLTDATTNTNWVANLAVYVPFTTDIAGTVYEWWWYNGTLTTAHNIAFGIYNLDFTAVQRLTGVAGGTTASAINNTTTWTDLVLQPGSYYMAMADDSTRNFLTSADALGLYQASGVMEQTGLGAGPALPDPMVPLVYARAFLPYFGMNLRTTAV